MAAAPLTAAEGVDDILVLRLIDTAFFAHDDPVQNRARRRAALIALGQLAADDDMVVSTFLASSRDPDPMLAREAVKGLGRTRRHRPRARVGLERCLSHPNAAVRDAARQSIRRLGPVAADTPHAVAAASK